MIGSALETLRYASRLQIKTIKKKKNFQGIDGLYCVGDSCFPGQGVIAVAFSGVMCAHRVAADIGKLKLELSLACKLKVYNIMKTKMYKPFNSIFFLRHSYLIRCSLQLSSVNL